MWRDMTLFGGLVGQSAQDTNWGDLIIYKHKTHKHRQNTLPTSLNARISEVLQQHFKQESPPQPLKPTVPLMPASSPQSAVCSLECQPWLPPLTAVINKAASHALSGCSSSRGDSDKCFSQYAACPLGMVRLLKFIRLFLITIFSGILSIRPKKPNV